MLPEPNTLVPLMVLMFVPDTNVSCLAATCDAVGTANATQLVAVPVKFTAVVLTAIGKLFPLPSESVFNVPSIGALSPVFINPGYVPAGVKPFNEVPIFMYYSKCR